MKRIQQWLVLAAAAALCLSLAACGGGASSAEASPDAGSEAAASPASESSASDASSSGESEAASEASGETTQGELTEMLTEALAYDQEYPLLYTRTTANGEGSIDGNPVYFELSYEYNQQEDNDNLSDKWEMTLAEADGSDDAQSASIALENYYTDGTYYAALNYTLYESEIPTIQKKDISLEDLIQLAAGGTVSEGVTGSLDTEAEIYSFTVDGEQLRSVIETWCPPLMLDLTEADWSSVSADVELPVSKYGWIREITIDSPSLGTLVMQHGAADCETECSSFTLELYCASESSGSSSPSALEMSTLQDGGDAVDIPFSMICDAMIEEVFSA